MRLPIPFQYRPLTPWERTNYHTWFAWRPVVTENGYLVWLETVKQEIVLGGSLGYYCEYYTIN